MNIVSPIPAHPESASRVAMSAAFRISFLLLVGGFACSGKGLFAQGEPPVETRLIIDLAAKRQVIDHFGANDAWSFQKIGAWSENSKNRIADLLYSTDKGIGLSFCRFYVGAGINRKTIHDEWRTADTFEISEGRYDWSKLANERWFLRAAKTRGVRSFGMTIYSPPPRLTRNGLTNLGSDPASTTNLKPGGEESFAKYLTDILAHFRTNPDENERIEFDRIFPINEPQWEWNANQEGNRASNDDIRRIHLALRQQLQKSGLRTFIAGPESGSIPDMTRIDAPARNKWKADYGDYLRFLGDDKQLAKGLGGVMTYHSYWSDRVPDQLVAHREELGAALAKRPGWKLWQSEYCVMEHGRDLGMETALRVARVIHCDLTLANASAWQWWLAVSRGNYKDGLIYTDWKQPGDAESILPSKTLWALGNFSRFIRPGMQRVDVRGPAQDVKGLMTSAYLDPANKRLVVVCINFGAQPKPIGFSLARGERVMDSRLRMIPYTTSPTKDLEAGPALDSAGGIEIPAGSVVTLVSQP